MFRRAMDTGGIEDFPRLDVYEATRPFAFIPGALEAASTAWPPDGAVPGAEEQATRLITSRKANPTGHQPSFFTLMSLD